MKKNKRYLIDYKHKGITYYTRRGTYTGFGREDIIHCAHIVIGDIRTIKRQLKELKAFDVSIKEV